MESLRRKGSTLFGQFASKLCNTNETIANQVFFVLRPDNSDFCGIESSNQVPNGDTIGRFRNILIQNGLQEKLFQQVVDLLTEQK